MEFLRNTSTSISVTLAGQLRDEPQQSAFQDMICGFFVTSLCFFKYRSRRPLEAWVSRTWATKTCCGSWVVKVETWEMCLKLKRWMSLIAVDSACVCDFGWQLQSSRCRNMSRLMSRQIGVSAQVLLSTAFLSSLQNLMTCRDLIVEDFWWWIQVAGYLRCLGSLWFRLWFLCSKLGVFFSNLYNWRMREIKRCMQFLEIATVNCQVWQYGLGECHAIPDATLGCGFCIESVPMRLIIGHRLKRHEFTVDLDLDDAILDVKCKINHYQGTNVIPILSSCCCRIVFCIQLGCWGICGLVDLAITHTY